MIYLFRIISDESQDFYRDLVIDGSDTFLDFHKSLQQDLEYDPTLLASFIITNDRWEKQQEITLIDMMQDPAIPMVTMDQVTLDDYITEENQRMIYVYDFFSERAFFIELLEKTELTSPRETPFIGHGEGNPPPQVALDLLMDDADEFDGYSDEENEYDEEDLRLDDMDLDLFDDINPEDY
jgi:hypothetical protein